VNENGLFISALEWSHANHLPLRLTIALLYAYTRVRSRAGLGLYNAIAPCDGTFIMRPSYYAALRVVSVCLSSVPCELLIQKQISENRCACFLG